MDKTKIIKALECCGDRVKAKCGECPMGEKRGCAIELYRKALEFIKENTTEADDDSKTNT
jgi:hypothetical protein